MVDDPFDRLGRELEDAAARQVAAAAVEDVPQATRPPRRRRRSLGLFGAIVAMPVLAATAWAASALISTGSPVAYRHGAPVSGVGFGAPITSTVKLLTANVPDPDGGLPWGLRSFRTTRGMVCVQIGRVYEGKLGVVGRDGSFGDDGRFHELRPGVVADRSSCFPPDGAGHAYLTYHDSEYVASGEPCPFLSCLDGEAIGRPADSKRRPPPRSALRSVDYGLLGPQATSVTYRAEGGTRTMRTLGAEGGYLVVRRPLPPVPLPERFRRLPMASASGGGMIRREYMPAMTPASRVITRVRYGDAGSCEVRARSAFDGGARRTGGCPDPPGFVPIAQARPGALRAKVSATAVNAKEIRVRFRARVAVRDRLSAYFVTVHRPPRPCPVEPGRPAPSPPRLCSWAFGDSTDRNIPAGRVIVKDLAPDERLRRGRWRIEVRLRTQQPHPSPGGNLKYPGTLVGRTTLVVR